MAVIKYTNSENNNARFLDNLNHVVAIRKNKSQDFFAKTIGTTKDQIKLVEKGHFVGENIINSYIEIGEDLGYFFNKL